MNKYQNTVLWLGLALIVLRFLTSGQRSLFHSLFTSGGVSDITPVFGGGTSQNSGNAPTPKPQPNAPAKPPKQTVPLPIASNNPFPGGITGRQL